MIKPQAAPAPDRAGGRRGAHPEEAPTNSPDRRHRRLEKRRHHRNRNRRSRTTVVSWDAEGLRLKQAELERWLPTVNADVVAIKEAQLPKAAPRLKGFQPPVDVRRARGRTTGACIYRRRLWWIQLHLRAGGSTLRRSIRPRAGGLRRLDRDMWRQTPEPASPGHHQHLPTAYTGRRTTNDKITSTRADSRATDTRCWSAMSTDTTRPGTRAAPLRTQSEGVR